jgi:prevent-host-death family protein
MRGASVADDSASKTRPNRAPPGAAYPQLDSNIDKDNVQTFVCTSVMPSVGIRKLGRSLSAVVREVRETGEPAVVTDRGRPVVLMVPIDQEQLEDFVLANAPAFATGMQSAENDLASGQTRSLEETTRARKRS